MLKSDNAGEGAFTNMLWRFAERTGAQIVSFIVSIIIARIVGPSAYGIVAIVNVFTNILFVFVDSGLGNSLIQKKDSDDLDFSTVFLTNIFICVILYFILFLVAPFIASFYSNGDLISITRVAGLTLLLSSVKNVQQAYVSKYLLFRKFFFATLIGTILSAIFGVTLALLGFGVWALVLSGLINNFVDTVVLWTSVKWRPNITFSFGRLKRLLSFGSRILLANLLQVFYSNIYDLFIGKRYSSSDLAYFNKGRQLPNLLVNSVDDSINSVLLPILSYKQEDVPAIRRMTKRALKINVYIMTPIMVGLFAVSEPLVRVLLGVEWMPMVPFLRIFSLIQVFRPFATSNLSAMKALGRSDLFFKLEIVKDAVGISILLLSLKYGPFGIAVGLLITTILTQIINSTPNKWLIGYSFLNQICDTLPIMLLSIIMGGLVYLILLFRFNDIVTVILQCLTGAAVYVSLSMIFKVDSFFYILDKVSNVFQFGEMRKNG